MVVLLLAIAAVVAALAAAGGALVLRRRRAAGPPVPRARSADTGSLPGTRAAVRMARLPGRRTRVGDQLGRGPFLYWVPDGRGGSRLAGHFIPEPEPEPRVATRAQRTGLRRGMRRTG